ncbi:MAG: tetratricopeptide repeat protein [Chloroflexi bacterium]|nr:tetratricopeptide repeat protein [Chloroflexota bacterium]
MSARRLTPLRIGLGLILLGSSGGALALGLMGNDSGVTAAAPTSMPELVGAGSPTRTSTQMPTAIGIPLPPAGGSTASVDERVAFWEARVAANATDYSSTIALIDGYLDRVRATGDLADLVRADSALARARALAPTGDVRLLLREGQVAFTQHDFTAARDAAGEALELDPGNEAAVALLGDASLELGDEAGATNAYERLAPLAATAPVLSRRARYDLLTGDTVAAEAGMRAAVEAAEIEGFADQAASYRLQLAELLRGENRVDEAAAVYEAILDATPDHVRAMGGLARIREAQGRRADAIELLERATTRLPMPDLVADLGDLHALDGRSEAASESYALVERIAEVARASGGVYDRQLVLFLADHAMRVDEAVEIAEAELRSRKDVYGHDALAWALYRAGRLDEADAAAREAMRLGTPDGRILYHAGLIAMALGRTDDALDLLTGAAAHEAALPPIQVPELRAALDALQD